MRTYNVYGLGNALVDAEFEVTDEFLKHENIQKGLMTLVDGEAQKILYDRLVAKFGIKKRDGGGSAANSMYAVSQFGGSASFKPILAASRLGGEVALARGAWRLVQPRGWRVLSRRAHGQAKYG